MKLTHNLIFFSLIIFGCQSENKIIVTWEKNPFSTDIHNEIYIDTINRVPYSNPYLNEILFIDSVLKSINLEQIESEENIANDYILTLYRSAHIIND